MLKAARDAQETEQRQSRSVEATGPVIEEAPDDEKAAEVRSRLPRPYRRRDLNIRRVRSRRC